MVYYTMLEFTQGYHNVSLCIHGWVHGFRLVYDNIVVPQNCTEFASRMGFSTMTMIAIDQEDARHLSDS